MLKMCAGAIVAMIFFLAAGRQCARAAVSDSLLPAQQKILASSRVDSLQLARFASLCMRAGDPAVFIDTYRKLVKKRAKTPDVADLPVLLGFYRGIDTAHPDESSFNICYWIARVLIINHVNDTAPERYLRDELSIARKLPDKCFTIKALNQRLAFVQNIRHDMLSAYELLTEADSFAKRNGIDRKRECGIDPGGGWTTLYYYLQDYGKGIEIINQVISVTPPSGNDAELFDLYVRRSLLETELGYYNVALHSLDSARRCISSAADQGTFMNYLYADSFINYVLLGDLKRAGALKAKVNIAILGSLNDEFYDYLYRLVQYDIHMHEWEDAKLHISMYLPHLKPWNIQRWRNIYEVKYKLNKALGNAAEALQDYERYTIYNDSVHYQARHNAVIAQQIRYHTKEKEDELRVRSYQMSILESKNRAGTVYLWVTAFFLLMAIVIVILVYVNYKRSRKNVRQLTLLKEELEKRDKEKDRIMNVVAHDLRNPVGGIAYLSDLMQMEGGSSMSYKDAMGMIKASSVGALDLINELLGHNSITKGMPQKQLADLGLLVEECVAQLKHKAIEKQQVLAAELPADRVIANVDRGQMLRVLANLVSNAIKFSPQGASVSISLKQQAQHAAIVVKDEGIGIPAHMQAGAFDMLTSSKRYGTAGEPSFGLGLSICRQIVEAHGGRIWLESEEGRGTTVFIALPV